MTTDELAKLMPEEKRIKIAEACGWENIVGRDVDNKPWGYSPKRPHEWRDWYPVPDFLNDLNAMHEAEKILKPMAKGYSSRPQDHPHWMFASHLTKILGLTLWDNGKWVGAHNASLFPIAHATAAQRADAFLLTI